jgi:hypothetical protein
MGATCSMHERGEKCLHRFSRKPLKGGHNAKDLGVGGRIKKEIVCRLDVSVPFYPLLACS